MPIEMFAATHVLSQGTFTATASFPDRTPIRVTMIRGDTCSAHDANGNFIHELSIKRIVPIDTWLEWQRNGAWRYGVANS